MNALQIFNYQEKQVRTVLKDEEPWFVAADVCAILDLNTSEAVNGKGRSETEGLEDDEKGIDIVDTPGGKQSVIVVSEPGLYALVWKSRKPEAKTFKRWITHEVIPQIRKTGSYLAKPQSIEDLIIMQAQSVKELRAQVTQVEDKLANVNYRIDSLDGINIEGDARQRLVKMVQKYSHDKGLAYNKGWHNFKKAFNLTYHTNLELLITNFEQKTGMKNVTTPGYLAAVNRLEDGIRVADKMLNGR